MMRFPLAAAAAMILAACGDRPAHDADTDDASPPAVVQVLVDRGLTIDREFTSEAGLRGFVGRANGQTVVFYVTDDDQYLLLGNMVDADGVNLTAQHAQRYAPQPDLDAAWDELGATDWVPDGADDAPRIVYVFTDPNCPFCHQFWEAARAYVGTDVQLRHIMVGMLRESSTGKSARIMTADDPGAALAEHERAFDDGGAEPLAEVPEDIAVTLERNEALMYSLGAHGTPAIFYRDADGNVQRVAGMPQSDDQLHEIFTGAPSR